jgi:catechol 2,3-dioxygenase-like lactoylglutathione lyase family enzyme
MWIGVVTDDLERQRHFYEHVLGFRETSSEGWLHLHVPGGGLFELIQRDPSPQYESRRYQIGFTVDDIRAARDQLIRRGVEAISEIDGDEAGSTNLWCYFRDPERNVSRSLNGSGRPSGRQEMRSSQPVWSPITTPSRKEPQQGRGDELSG